MTHAQYRQAREERDREADRTLEQLRAENFQLRVELEVMNDTRYERATKAIAEATRSDYKPLSGVPSGVHVQRRQATRLRAVNEGLRP